MATEVPPFATDLRLCNITLDCGAITLVNYNRAPGGNFGKVLCGSYRNIRVAVKILALKQGLDEAAADAAFRKETANLLAIRSAIDRARTLRCVGAPLTEPCDFSDPTRRCNEPHSLVGFKHAAFVFGVGTEPDLSAITPGLPVGPAHLIVMEELTGGTLESSLEVPKSIRELVEIANGLASGLSLLAAAHVVHADVKVGV